MVMIIAFTKKKSDGPFNKREYDFECLRNPYFRRMLEKKTKDGGTQEYRQTHIKTD